MTSVDEMRATIMGIFRSETAGGGLLWADHGAREAPTKSWSASIWKTGGQMLEVVVVQTDDETCRVTAHPITSSSASVIDLQGETLEPELRQLIATLRSTSEA